MTAAPKMKVGAIAPWFGSKRTLAPTIVEELGPHRSYWEPFCGSMAVLLAKPRSSMETVNDLHADLINLARVIQHPVDGPRLYRRLRRVLVSPVAQAEATDALGQGDAVDRAFSYFAHAWLSRNGVAGTYKNNSNFCRRYTSGGGSPAKRFESTVLSIPAWRERLRNVQILNDDAFEMIAKIEDAANGVIYLDPPYLVKGAKYAHDFDDQIFWLMPDGSVRKQRGMPDCKAKRISAHMALAVLLRRFKKTRVVVSYYEHSDLAELYPGWTKREVHTTKAMVSQGQRGESGGAVTAPEVLLINGPSLAREAA